MLYMWLLTRVKENFFTDKAISAMTVFSFPHKISSQITETLLCIAKEDWNLLFTKISK